MSPDTPISASLSASASDRESIFFRAAQVLLKEKDFAVLAKKIFELSREITGAQSGYVALLSKDGKNNEVLFLEAGGLPCSVDPTLPMPLRGLREKAYASHQPVLHNDFMQSEWVSFMPEGHVDLKNVLFAPLNVDSTTLGIMGLANKPDPGFTDEDSRTAGMLAELIAMGLKNNITERRLAESESRYRTIVENVTDSLFIHDFKGTILDVNDHACRMLGYERSELFGSSLSHFKAPRDEGLLSRRMNELLEQGFLAFDVDLVHKDGSIIHCSISAKLVSRDGDGVIQSFAREIGNRKKMELALKEREELFRSTIEQSADGFLMTDANMRITEWNAAMKSLFGYSREEMVGKLLFDFQFLTLPQKDRTPKMRQRLLAAMGTIRSERTEAFMSRPQEMEVESKNGDRKTVQISVFPIFTSTGVRFGSLIRDITDVKKTEAALIESDRLLVKAQKLAHIGHFKLDPVSRTVQGSDELFSIFGLSRDKFTFESFLATVHPDDREFVTSTIAKSIESGVPYDIEHWLLCTNGEKKFINTIGEPEKDASGRTVQVISTVQDITERKLMESVLAESEERFRLLFENMVEGFSVQEIITDKSGTPVDFRFIDVNAAHELHTGLKRQEILGKTIKEILPDVSDEQIVRYGKVALTGEPITFEYYSSSFNRHFRVSAFSPIHGRFATIFEDITDSKRSEIALRSSEERFRQLAENIRSVFWVGSPDWKQVHYVSPAYHELWGRSCESLYEHPLNWLDALPFEDMEKVGAAMEAVTDTDWKILRFPEFRVRRPDTTVRWVSATAYPVRDEKGRIVRVAGVADDVTERKNIQDALRREQERTRLYLDIMGVILVVLDERANILLINKKGCSLLGYSAEELYGKNWIESCIPAENRQAEAKVFRQIMTGRIRPVSPAESHVLCKDGSRRLIAWNSEIIKGETGQITASISSGEDVTARRRAEAALAESERRNRDLLKAIPDIIFKVLNNGTILDAKFDSPAQLFLPPDKIHGANIYDLPLQKGDIERVRRTMSMALTTGEVRTCTYSLPLLGSDRHFEARFIRELENTAIIIVRDITENKRAEENMIKTEKLESLGHMAGGIAHDFNNLLGGVFGYLEMAKEQAEGKNIARTAQYLSKALTVFDRAKGLTRQFLTFAKGGAPSKKTGDLGALLRSAVPFALSGSNVVYDLQVARDLWPCDFDEHQMGQVIDNLVINAKQAMEKGGRLDVVARNISLDAADKTLSLLPGRYLRIDFRDSGPGISRELQQKIFDPFFTTKKTGTGLGLATAYSIISKHGGHIDLESEPGKGTCFFIYLPASESPVDPESADNRTLKKGYGRVLLMDDEVYVRDFGSGMLKNLGYSVDTAKNGSDAVALYKEALRKKKPYKAAIFDLTIIGGMGGKEAAQKIISLDPKARLIVSSGYSEDPVMANPTQYGFCERIGKPYRKEELAEVLSRIVKPGRGRSAKTEGRAAGKR